MADEKNVAEAEMVETDASPELQAQIENVGNSAFELLRTLPYPWAAAWALGGVMVLLVEHSVEDASKVPEAEVRERLNGLVTQALHCWRERRKEEKEAEVKH